MEISTVYVTGASGGGPLDELFGGIILNFPPPPEVFTVKTLCLKKDIKYTLFNKNPSNQNAHRMRSHKEIQQASDAYLFGIFFTRASIAHFLTSNFLDVF